MESAAARLLHIWMPEGFAAQPPFAWQLRFLESSSVCCHVICVHPELLRARGS